MSKTVRLDVSRVVRIRVAQLDGKPPIGLAVGSEWSHRSVSLSPRKAREIAAALVAAAEFVEQGKAS